MRTGWLLGRVTALLLIGALGAGCDERQVSVKDGAIKDAPVDALADAPPDVIADIPPPDTVADAPPGACGCKPGEVWLKSSCTPTLELGCAPRCSGTCAKAGYTCEPCGAQPDCTKPSASLCAPACVPSASSPSTPLPSPLRIQPVSGLAGQQTLVVIEGARFYIGALFYLVRVNGGAGAMDQPVSKPCATSFPFTPPAPGVYTVEVSQYGGNAPWVLAGFFTATAGAPPTGDVQPGFACGAGDTCHSGPGYTCSCQSGRCRCQ